MAALVEAGPSQRWPCGLDCSRAMRPERSRFEAVPPVGNQFFYGGFGVDCRAMGLQSTCSPLDWLLKSA
jgi:hypothetical protein